MKCIFIFQWQSFHFYIFYSMFCGIFKRTKDKVSMAVDLAWADFWAVLCTVFECIQLGIKHGGLLLLVDLFFIFDGLLFLSGFFGSRCMDKRSEDCCSFLGVAGLQLSNKGTMVLEDAKRGEEYQFPVGLLLGSWRGTDGILEMWPSNNCSLMIVITG